MNKKKETIRVIRQLRKVLKDGKPEVVYTHSNWDIHSKEYTILEVAARFLRMKGGNININISDNTLRPAYEFGYIRFYRYAKINLNKNEKI